MGTFNSENLYKLIENTSDDKTTNLILNCLKSFEDYHAAIYTMEVRAKVLKLQPPDPQSYQDTISKLDGARTIGHNAVIANVNILNRLAERSGIAPVYDGVVSEERQHRRELADAVLGYVEGIILARV